LANQVFSHLKNISNIMAPATNEGMALASPKRCLWNPLEWRFHRHLLL